MSAPFQPGDRVVCVDAGPSEEFYAPPELVEGAHYTVYALGKDAADEWGVFLDEMESAGFAGGYLAYRFRKIDAADETFTATIRACKPVKTEQPA